MKRNVSAVRFKFRCNILISGEINKEIPGSVASGTHCSTIYGTVWWADGRPILSVVLWLWLSAVLHYSWVVIRLIALHWKEGWTKSPPEPTDSKKGVKCWEEYSWLFRSVYNDYSS